MPLYNHAAYVGEAIGSVRQQSFGDWELIVVDDGSSDGSGAIADNCAQSDNRIKVIHQANAGVAAARNAAIARAAGQWLAFLDSDDVYLPSALEDFHRCIQDNPQAKFIYGWSHRLGPGQKITELKGEFQQSPTGPNELFTRMYLSHRSLCFRRELIDLVGNYNPNLPVLEDYDLFLRISLHTTFQPLGKVTALRRRHDHNISAQSGFSRMLEGAVLRRFMEKMGGRDVLDPAIVGRRLAKIYYSAGREYFKRACFANAANALAISLGYRKTAKVAAIWALSKSLCAFGKKDRRKLPSLDA
jgi:glycosyltransferase involved in cell wall biosynthesis